MQGQIEEYRDCVNNDWDFQESSAEEYSAYVLLGSRDKLLSVDADHFHLPENFYRQIHEDEKVLTRFIGYVPQPTAPVRIVVLNTSGIVDARSKSRLFLTVKSQQGDPVQLILPRSSCTGRVPSKGDSVRYTVYRSNFGELAHEIEVVPPPQLSAMEEEAIDARIDKLSF